MSYSIPVKRTEPRRFDAVIAAPSFGLGLVCADGMLTGLDFLPPGTPLQPACTALAQDAAAQLRAYLRDPAHRFELPLRPAGSAFRQRVWHAIAAIPPGETRRYGDLARELASVPRAVGQACGDNPLPVVVPCHRVVAAAGIGGFAHQREGYLLNAKRWLLEHESRLARI